MDRTSWDQVQVRFYYEERLNSAAERFAKLMLQPPAQTHPSEGKFEISNQAPYDFVLRVHRREVLAHYTVFFPDGENKVGGRCQFLCSLIAPLIETKPRSYFWLSNWIRVATLLSKAKNSLLTRLRITVQAFATSSSLKYSKDCRFASITLSTDSQARICGLFYARPSKTHLPQSWVR